MSSCVESASTSSDEDCTPSYPRSDKSHNAPSRPKEQSRLRTSFQLAHPPPNSLSKGLRIRPKLLLQLQQISYTGRPTPVLDVLQSTSFARKLARILPGTFRSKGELGLSDLIVLTSGLYAKLGSAGHRGSTSSEDDFSEHREVVATISQTQEEKARGEGKAEIRFKHGPSWEATPLPNGSYDFVVTDENGQRRTVRWALRRKGSGRSGSEGLPLLGSSMDENKKFTFSAINPGTRRHPVTASVTRMGINVIDHYSVPTTTDSCVSSLPLSAAPDSSKHSSDVGPVDSSERSVVRVDDNLRTLILITGIWVMFQQGWSES
ncbi:MAG: hypothetical protein M1834_008225 [Cirrosporium novae-zelandiae]|nr:MAG: hypothetical protein M1834_008225 [Cirrosporium novae-zelandiae]